jgi:hypothetical protein
MYAIIYAIIYVICILIATFKFIKYEDTLKLLGYQYDYIVIKDVNCEEIDNSFFETKYYKCVFLLKPINYNFTFNDTIKTLNPKIYNKILTHYKKNDVIKGYINLQNNVALIESRITFIIYMIQLILFPISIYTAIELFMGIFLIFSCILIPSVSAFKPFTVIKACCLFFKTIL